jgi:hypothetical protein
MGDYSAARTVIDASREELIAIFQWVHTKGEDPEKPVTVLIGGWAVHNYNPWYGSIDIDIITNKRTRQHLMKFLRDERGFILKRHPMIPNTVVKNTRAGEIRIDFGSREDICRFEGREENCPFSLLDGQTTTGTIVVPTNGLPFNRSGFNRGGFGSFPIVVPARTLLLLFKLKAAWDRSHRLQNGTSSDPEWEQGKVRKDRADILSLLDPAAGGTDIDIQYLGLQIREYPFLIDVLEDIPLDSDAVGMYRRLSPMQVREVIDRLLSLVR